MIFKQQKAFCIKWLFAYRRLCICLNTCELFFRNHIFWLLIYKTFECQNICYDFINDLIFVYVKTEKYNFLSKPKLDPKVTLTKSDLEKQKLRSEKCSYLQNECSVIAETWCRLRSYHVYTGLDFFRSGCVMSSWNKMMCNNFIAKGDLIQQPHCPIQWCFNIWYKLMIL